MNFSVIISTSNEGDWLQSTVESVIEINADKNSEIGVVVDGWTDHSLGLIQKSKLPNVKLFESTSELGLSSAKTIGGEMATGDHLVFIDSYMVPQDPNWLGVLESQLGGPQVGAARLKIPSYTSPKAIGYIYRIKNTRLTPAWVGTKKTGTQETPLIPGGCFAIGKELFERTGG